MLNIGVPAIVVSKSRERQGSDYRIHLWSFDAWNAGRKINIFLKWNTFYSSKSMKYGVIKIKTPTEEGR
jgi:hypothetical protein